MEWLQDVRLCVLVVAHKKIGHKRGCSKFEPWSPGWSIFSDTHVFENSKAIREIMISLFFFGGFDPEFGNFQEKQLQHPLKTT